MSVENLLRSAPALTASLAALAFVAWMAITEASGQSLFTASAPVHQVAAEASDLPSASRA